MKNNYESIVHFGSFPNNVTSNLTLFLGNENGGTAKLTNLKLSASSDAEFSLTTGSVSAGSVDTNNHEVKVSFLPTSDGLYSAEIEFEYENGNFDDRVSGAKKSISKTVLFDTAYLEDPYGHDLEINVNTFIFSYLINSWAKPILFEVIGIPLMIWTEISIAYQIVLLIMGAPITELSQEE